MKIYIISILILSVATLADASKIHFTRDEILKGREIKNPLNDELENNLTRLQIAVSKLREAYGKPLLISSGYRPKKINKAVGGSKNSAHLTCQAVDIADPEGLFTMWILDNLELLNKAGLYMEDPKYTRILDSRGKVKVQWIHLQLRVTDSGNRIFTP